MKYLLDSNILLTAALQRPNWQQATEFLAKVSPSDVAIADFSLHAMGYYLTPKTPDLFDEIIADILARNTTVLRIEPAQLTVVTRNARQYRLDFDDAFVYTVAESHGLDIVSFDAHFDRTPRGRRTPAAALAGQ